MARAKAGGLVVRDSLDAIDEYGLEPVSCLDEAGASVGEIVGYADRAQFELLGVDDTNICSETAAKLAAVKETVDLGGGLRHAIDCELDWNLALAFDNFT